MTDEVTSPTLGGQDTRAIDEGWDPATSRMLESGADLLSEGEPPERPRDLTKKAARGFVLSVGAFLFLQVVSFATYTVAGRFLSASELGVAAKFLTVVFWMDVLLDMGMGAAVIRDQEKGQTDRVGVAFSVNAMVSVVVSLGLLLAAPGLASYFGVSSYVNVFRLLALLALFRGLGQVPSAMLARDMAFGRMTTVGIIRASLRFLVAVSLLSIGVGPAAMAISVVAAEIVGTVLSTILARFRPQFRWDSHDAADLLRYGLSIFGARLVGMFWLNGDYLVVASKLSDAQYGDYYTAFRLPELLLGSVYNMFSSVAFPAYSAARQDGPEKLKRAYLDALKLLCLYGFPVSVGLALIARDFLGLAFPSHPAAIPVMELLCAAGGFVAVGYASGDLFNAINKPRLALYFNLMGAPILITGFLLVVDRGIVAIAAVHAAVIVPYSIFRLEVANRLIKTSWAQTLRALLPAAGCTAGVLLFALPVRLTMPPGTPTMLVIILAGVIGGSLGLMVCGRDMFGQLKGLVEKALRR